MSSTDQNFVRDLFDWKIRNFISIKVIRFFNLVGMISVILVTLYFEFIVGRTDSIPLILKLLLLPGIVLASICVLVILRMSSELYLAIFYGENHLRQIASKK